MTRTTNRVVPVSARSAVRHSHSDPRMRERVLGLILLSPSVIAILIFVYGFVVWTGWISLLDWNNPAPFRGILPEAPVQGLETYVRLFQTDRFQIDIRNILVFTILFLFVCLVVGLTLAMLLDQKVRGAGVFRNIFLFPLAFSFIATGVVWRWLLAPRAGVNLLLNAAQSPLSVFGFEPIVLGWYTDPTVLHIPAGSMLGQSLAGIGLGGLASERFGVPVAILAPVLAATWQMSGFVMLLYLVGLRAVPEELCEAARIDGANRLQTFRHVIFPLLRPITLTALVILGDVSLRLFDLVLALSGQGPAFATDVPALYMFATSFQASHFSQGAAISILMLLAVSALVVPYLVHRVRGGAA